VRKESWVESTLRTSLSELPSALETSELAIFKQTRGKTTGQWDLDLTHSDGIDSEFFLYRSIGVGGRVDTSNFERDSSSPTGSLNGRRRGRTFETGIQVNESELLDKDPPPPLLLITEKHDFGGQADFDQILTPKSGYTDLLYHQMGIPKVVTSTGILVKPTTSERGMLFKVSKQPKVDLITSLHQNLHLQTVPFPASILI